MWFHHWVGGLSREQVGILETVDQSFIPTQQDTVIEVRRRYLEAGEILVEQLQARRRGRQTRLGQSWSRRRVR